MTSLNLMCARREVYVKAWAFGEPVCPGKVDMFSRR